MSEPRIMDIEAARIVELEKFKQKMMEAQVKAVKSDPSRSLQPWKEGYEYLRGAIIRKFEEWKLEVEETQGRIPSNRLAGEADIYQNPISNLVIEDQKLLNLADYIFFLSAKIQKKLEEFQ